MSKTDGFTNSDPYRTSESKKKFLQLGGRLFVRPEMIVAVTETSGEGHTKIHMMSGDVFWVSRTMYQIVEEIEKWYTT